MKVQKTDKNLVAHPACKKYGVPEQDKLDEVLQYSNVWINGSDNQ